jgi:hypothetical protein
VFENNVSHCKHEVAVIIVRARFAAVSTQAQVAKYFMTIKNSLISQKDKASCAGRRSPPKSTVTLSVTSCLRNHEYDVPGRSGIKLYI